MSTSIVETQYGKVQGAASGPVFVWKGIPYAQPPLGDLRFRAPQSPIPWSGVRDATALHMSWIMFARSGNPNTAGLPQWPAYDTTRRATMLFNEECQVVNDPQSTERQVWEGVL